MMFDNSPPPSQPRAETVKRNVVLALVALGVLALAVGVHTATTALVGVAIGHLVLAAVIAGISRFREGDVR